MNAEKAFFQENGYILIKKVYDKYDISAYRKRFVSIFEKELWKKSRYNSPTIINDIYQLFPDLLNIIINENYINAIKKILGEEVVWLPECAIHHNRYINWHKDTTEQEIKGLQSHKVQHEFLIQSATYFQDNSSAGGGITVIPKSHLGFKEDKFKNLYRKQLHYRVHNKIKKTLKISPFDKADRNKNSFQIPNEVGDLLLFDVRIDHKSSGGKCIENQKFAIFNTFGNANNFTKDYLLFMKNRPEPYYEHLRNTKFAKNLYHKAQSLNIKIWE